MASIGVGVVILSHVWFAAFVLVWLSIRTGLALGQAAIFGSVVFTIILYMLPKIEVDLEFGDILYDKFYSARHFSIGVIFLGNIVGAAYYNFLYTAHEPIRTSKIRRFGS